MAVSRLVIYPYKMGSQSAKKLAQRVSSIIHLKVRRVRSEGMYKPRRRSIVLNWGNSNPPRFNDIVRRNGITYDVLNRWDRVALASNKITAFERFKEKEIPTPDWTTDQRVAQGWLNEGEIVLSRTLLTSHSGRGIHINDLATSNLLVRAPLYVKYKKKRKEFRVHVFKGQVIDLAEKRKFRLERRDASFVGLVRNHDNGWAFCRDGIVEPDGLRSLALTAVSVLGLSFGACDIIWNEKENKLYVLEVNTAPGLEGTTLERYSNAVTNLLQS